MNTAWDHDRPVFTQGSIQINFYNNIVGYTAGDCVSGTIDIQLTSQFLFNDLTLEFVGLERVCIKSEKQSPHHREFKTIIQLKQIVDRFSEELLPGQYTYPFMLYLPDWLPDSTHLKQKDDHLFVEYTLRAQFRSNNLEDMSPDGVSLYRGSRVINIYQEQTPSAQIFYRQDLTYKSSWFGFGEQKSLTRVYYTQCQYQPGSSVMVSLTTDNTECTTAIRQYKFKCFRKVVYKDRLTAFDFTQTESIFKFKEPGIGAQKKTKRDFMLKIPTQFQDQPLQGTYLGCVFQIKYILIVEVQFDYKWFTKHNSIIELPLQVTSLPRLTQSDEDYRVPSDWQPLVMQRHPCCLFMENPYKRSDYYLLVAQNFLNWYLKWGISCPQPWNELAERTKAPVENPMVAPFKPKLQDIINLAQAKQIQRDDPMDSVAMQSFGFGMGEGHANYIQGDIDTDYYKQDVNEGSGAQVIIEKLKKYPFCNVSSFVGRE